MNLNSVSFALSQISYLVENLNKKNFKSSHSEILTVFNFRALCLLFKKKTKLKIILSL